MINPGGRTELCLPLADTMSYGLGQLKDHLRTVAVYSLFPNTLRAAQKRIRSYPMTSTGDNWVSTLKALNQKEWGAKLSAALYRITGDIDDDRVVQAGGFVIPEFRHGKGRGGKGIGRGAGI